jgi:hypothetical protein
MVRVIRRTKEASVILGTEKNDGHCRTVTCTIIAVICGRSFKEAMFSCQKVRHIAYYEPSVYLAWCVECAIYMSFAILLTNSQGLR